MKLLKSFYHDCRICQEGKKDWLVSLDFKEKSRIITSNLHSIVDERNEYVYSDSYSEPMAVRVRRRSVQGMDSGDAA